MTGMQKFEQYINNLVKRGKCCFSLDEAQTALGKTKNAISLSIAHLSVRGKLVSPAHGFYIIVPPEYQELGSIPPEQFIPYLMNYWGYKYYVGLLTASVYYGASHQASHIYQVVIDQKRPALLTSGRFEIQFINNKNIDIVALNKRATPKSYLNISSPEWTAIDLFLYPKASGGLSHIATILSELHESIDSKQLKNALQILDNNACKQRLGYVLEKIGAIELAEIVKENLSIIRYIPLMPEQAVNKSLPKSNKWKIIENINIESDI